MSMSNRCSAFYKLVPLHMSSANTRMVVRHMNLLSLTTAGSIGLPVISLLEDSGIESMRGMDELATLNS